MSAWTKTKTVYTGILGLKENVECFSNTIY